METDSVYLVSIAIAFSLVYLVFGLYVPDDVYLSVSLVNAGVLGVALVWGEYNDET